MNLQGTGRQPEHYYSPIKYCNCDISRIKGHSSPSPIHQLSWPVRHDFDSRKVYQYRQEAFQTRMKKSAQRSCYPIFLYYVISIAAAMVNNLGPHV